MQPRSNRDGGWGGVVALSVVWGKRSGDGMLKDDGGSEENVLSTEGRQAARQRSSWSSLNFCWRGSEGGIVDN